MSERTVKRRAGLALSALGAAIVFAATVIVTAPSATTAQADDAKLRAALPEVVDAAGPNERIPISIVLAAQVSRDTIRSLALTTDKEDRRDAVTSELKSLADRTQGDLVRYLESQRALGRVGENIRTLWLSNVVAADATPDIVRAVAARDDVAWVNHNPKVDISLAMPAPKPVPTPAPAPGPAPAPMAGGGRGSTTCGLDLVRAPEVWNDLGYDGTGTVVAVIDSGVCYNHTDLQNQMWINPGEDLDGDGVLFDPDDINGIDDDGNGFADDFIGWNFNEGNNDPNDDNGHGTHCAGTVAGDGSSGIQTGVAPGAKIMALRVGIFFSDEMDVWGAIQYAADNDADVISMSLGWPHGVGPDRATWRSNCDNAIAAGTVMSIAAGNEGNCCRPFDAVRTPGDVPGVITVGAVDCSDVAAGFTSRGPVTWQDVAPYNDFPHPPGLIKPVVSGPGVSTTSAALCSGYVDFSGTSMATPHVAGVIALMLQADPTLSTDVVELTLSSTGVDLGDPGQDNTYGFSRVDAVDAVTFALDPPGPEISGLTPDHGVNTVGTTVTISGKEFYGDPIVRFGGVQAPFATLIDENTIVTFAPTSPVLETVDLELETVGGTAMMVDAFTYMPNVSVPTTEVRPGDAVRFLANGPPGGDWGLLKDSASGGHVFRSFTTCLAGTGDFRVVDQSRRSPGILLNASGVGATTWTVPADAEPGDRFFFQGLFDGNGPEPGRPIHGTDCIELVVVP